jgi:hypothetical protein
MSRTAGDRTVTLATPIKNTVPTLGKKCGRRERGADAQSRWERSHLPSAMFRDGGRHPGLRDGGALRGASSERGPRSVRHDERGSSSLIGRTGDSRMSEGRRGGERQSAYAIHDQSVCTLAQGDQTSPLRSGRRVLHSVLRPVHVDRHYAAAAQAVVGGALSSVSRSGKPTKVGGTGTGVELSGRSAARRASPLPQGRGRLTRKEKEGGRGLRPCEDRELRLGCPHVVVTQLQKSVGDVWPRIRSAYAPPKGRSGSSEQGPRSGRSSAGDTVGGCIERKRVASRAHRIKTGELRRKAQGDVRASSSGRNIAKSGAAVAGPGL